VVLDNGAVRACDPLPLLQALYKSAHGKLIEGVDSYLDGVGAEERERWRQRMTEIRDLPPDESEECEVGLDRIRLAQEHLQTDEQTAKETRVRQMEELKSLDRKLEAESSPPSELAKDLERLRAELQTAIGTGHWEHDLVARGEELLRRVSQARAAASLRENRTALLRAEVVKLSAESTTSPTAHHQLAIIRQRLDDPTEPVESIAADIERVRASPPEVPLEGIEAPIEGTAHETQVFRNIEDDLTHLAELYRRNAILSTEIR
jgi:hypothetical protein